jgi:hypothetical protein
MSMVDQIRKNLVHSNKHGPILEALVDILEEQGDKGVKDRIKKWVEEIKAEPPPPSVTKE